MLPEITGSVSEQLTITEHGAPTRLDLVMPQEITGSVSVQLSITEHGAPKMQDLVMLPEITGSVSEQLTITEHGAPTRPDFVDAAGDYWIGECTVNYNRTWSSYKAGFG